MEGGSTEKKIKGTTIVDVVKTIRSLDGLPWDEHLSDEAKQLVSQRILASQWYDFGPALLCIRAMYKLVGKEDPELARQWAKANSRRMVEETYRGFVGARDLDASIMRFSTMARSNLVRGLEFEMEKIGDRHYRVTFMDDDPGTEVIYYFIQGWLEMLVEISGVSNYSVRFLEKHWEGSKRTAIDIEWEKEG
ncbi:MAG TPA: hypothetical protein VM658_15655 [bacterium]|nr:hypothetical protein [bacterium]